MKILTIAAGALLTAGLVAAQTHNQLTPNEKTQGWILLFDGKSFDGWEDPAKKTPAGDSFSIEDGTLKAKSRPQITEDLFSIRKFRDFDLQFDWRISKAGNSGLKYRIQQRIPLKPVVSKRFETQVEEAYANPAPRANGMAEYVVGFEYQCIDNNDNPDGRRGGSHASGALYDFVAPSAMVVKPVGEFNHSRLVVRGSHVEHWLNGVKVVDTDLKAPAIGEASAKRWGTGSKVAEFLTKQPVEECPISLQNHGDEAWFRDIKILPLK
jgi:hypothetical protein